MIQAPSTLSQLETKQDPESSGRPLLKLLFAIWASRRTVLSFGISAGAATAICAFLLPNSYRATAVIMPPQQQQSAASALMGQLGPLAALGGRDLGLKNPADLYIGIARSRTIADELIRRFHLEQVYHENGRSRARDELTRRTTIQAGKDTLISISVEDNDAQRAADLANAYVDELHKQNSRLAASDSGQRRRFFEDQLSAQRELLARAENELKATQQRTGVIDVGKQVEASMRALAELRAEIAGREILLTELKLGATRENPEVIRRETELSALKAQLRSFQNSRQDADPMLPTRDLPASGLEYVRRLRDLKYQEALYEVLAKQYEAARIDQARQAPDIQVVDVAVAPDVKCWPPRVALMFAGLIAGVVAGISFVLARLVVQRTRQTPAPDGMGASA